MTDQHSEKENEFNHVIIKQKPKWKRRKQRNEHDDRQKCDMIRGVWRRSESESEPVINQAEIINTHHAG